MRKLRSPLAIAAAVVAVCGTLAGTAAAVLTGSGGGTQVQMLNRAETTASTSSSTAWNTLPGSHLSVSVPSSGRLINARFTAESYCNGANSGYCTVRVMAHNASTGSTVELNPASSSDFAFDSNVSASNDMWESHAIERSRRLGPGYYRIYVERRVTNNSIALRLDDWHFAVEASA